DALRHLNEAALALLPPHEVEETYKVLRLLRVDPAPDPVHREITSKILEKLRSGSLESLGDLILQAAWVRRFLG
ncbi:MAG: phosphoenolpyruvate carboxylase, partial [Acidobacteria bacterium]|nr:phosphoenolpyruvate carboxylase [Acidobacteriota bacterium]MDW7984782.1 phosphoenolpyruvate carboxylase [Acidobacteriota bacterium]